jgi:hypothetical protein
MRMNSPLPRRHLEHRAAATMQCRALVARSADHRQSGDDVKDSECRHRVLRFRERTLSSPVDLLNRHATDDAPAVSNPRASRRTTSRWRTMPRPPWPACGTASMMIAYP